jgi:SAM-dependent methyltransferase
VTNTESWDRVGERGTGFPGSTPLNYGPETPTEDDLRLLGDVAGKRVLELGCGNGRAAVTLAKQGAHTIAIDASATQLAHGRALAAAEEVRVEWHEADLADLAFLRADSIDLALSVFALAEVDDVDRVFRQVQRVLRPGAPFVFSYEHPFALVAAGGFLDGQPMTVQREGEPIEVWPRSASAVFGALGRAGFRVDTLLEPPGRDPAMPAAIIWRARKEGQ